MKQQVDCQQRSQESFWVYNFSYRSPDFVLSLVPFSDALEFSGAPFWDRRRPRLPTLP